MFDLRKYRAVIFHGAEGWCKVWRKTDLWFGKWHEEYGTFSPEYFKFSKFGFWWDPLIQSRKSMSLKSAEELCVMKMKNDAKYEDELTFHFKTDMRNLTNFDSSTRKSKKMLFNWLLWSKYIMFELRKVQRNYVWWNWRLMQNLKERWLVLSKITCGIWQICIGWNEWMANLTKRFTDF